MELPILFENDAIVAVNKPAGIMTHPDGRNTEETASDWFAAQYPASATVGETQRLPDGSELLRPGVVHRLDRDTSGVLVFAKTQDAHAFLKAAFQGRDTKKTYIAVTYGAPKEKKGTIDFPIGRSRQDFRLRSAQPKAKGMLRDAITHYQVLAEAGEYALIQLIPETGRTHQIRVHLKAIHHPVVADPLYAPGKKQGLGFTRLALHALSLELPLPDGERVTLRSPLPADFAAAVETFPDGAGIVASL
ncbi:MAG TPA: RluA family pseudouridine synthase [Candidatus Paceibacterota bacterium]|nr:RluA family pseudouridine synthase [Candidatus Paceibacterota bacterium]